MYGRIGSPREGLGLGTSMPLVSLTDRCGSCLQSRFIFDDFAPHGRDTSMIVFV